ncbi:MAG: winged helix DNA-binding domain-containing protein [Actinomycetota bacterium]|nr:winged helix DNA-binding domain-containing protein [Actinomycetota bacterium]
MLGDEVAPVRVEGWDGWMLRDDVAEAAAARPSAVVCLLPAFDQYVVAAPRDDSPVLAEQHKARVYRRQGWLSPVLLVDGRIVGVWSHERRGGFLGVTIERSKPSTSTSGRSPSARRNASRATSATSSSSAGRAGSAARP